MHTRGLFILIAILLLQSCSKQRLASGTTAMETGQMPLLADSFQELNTYAQVSESYSVTDLASAETVKEDDATAGNSGEECLSISAGQVDNKPASTLSLPQVPSAIPSPTAAKNSPPSVPAFFLLLFALLPLGLFTNKSLRTGNGYKLSQWASRNRGKAQVWLFLSKLGLISLALFIGQILQAIGLTGAEQLYPIGAAGLLAGIILYPSTNRTSFGNGRSYRKRKLADLLLAVSGFLLVVANSQQLLYALPFHFEIPDYLTQPQAGPPNCGFAIFLVFLSLIAAWLLFSIVAAISCNLLCSGLEIAAYTVFFGGILLILAGLVFMVTVAVRACRKGGWNRTPKAESSLRHLRHQGSR